jgi:hypothetical protein
MDVSRLAKLSGDSVKCKDLLGRANVCFVAGTKAKTRLFEFDSATTDRGRDDIGGVRVCVPVLSSRATVGFLSLTDEVTAGSKDTRQWPKEIEQR